MRINWGRLGIGLAGWLIPPSLLVGAVSGGAGLILAVVAGRSAVDVFLIALAALLAGLVVARVALSIWDWIKSLSQAPPELKSEIAEIQRELIRHENHRQSNRGTVFPIERPYRDLPTERWDSLRGRLRLPSADQEAIARAYELVTAFNREMLANELTFAGENEPNLPVLRRAVDDAAQAVGLPAALDPRPPKEGEFERRNDQAELAQRCHAFAASLRRWVEGYQRKQSETTERYVSEWLQADPKADPAELRRRADEKYEKDARTFYAISYRSEAKDLFDLAYTEGLIAKEHERLALTPLEVEFERLPRLFDAIASRIYGEA